MHNLVKNIPLTEMPESERHFVLNGIQSSIDALEELIQSGESEFLLLGQQLQHIRRSALDIEKSQIHIASRLTEQSVSNAIDCFDSTVDQVKCFGQGYHAAVQTFVERFGAVVGASETLSKLVDNFYKLMGNFEKIGLMIRIENARLNHDDSVFQAFINAIAVLSEHVDKKIEKIIENVRLLKSVSQDKSRLIQSIQKEQARLSARVLNDLQECLQTIRDVYRQTSRTTDHIAHKAKSVSVHMDEMVTSIQFNDIVRQKLEHCVHTLRYLPESGSDLGLTGPGEWIHTCAMQIDHLDAAKHQMELAVQRIVRSLEEIACDIFSMNEQTQKMNEDSETGRSQELIRVEHIIGEIIHILYQENENMHLIVDAVENIFQIIHAITESIHDIESIESEVELISMNMMVNAAQLGQEGASLWVLADSIKGLSASTKINAGMLKEQVHIIRNHTESMCSGNQHRHLLEQTDSDVCGIVTLLQSTGLALKQADLEIAQSMTENKFKISRYVSDIQKTIAGITVHDFYNSRIDRAAEYLSKSIKRISSRSNQIDSDELRNNLEELKKRYTMQEERDIHASYMEYAELGSAEENESWVSTHNDNRNIEIF